MNISGVESLVPLKQLYGNSKTRGNAGRIEPNETGGFESIFKSALDLVKETNSLTNAAEQEEMRFALGYTDNIGNLMAAQRKASLSLQYTVAVRNTVMSAYRDIMNLQF